MLHPAEPVKKARSRNQISVGKPRPPKLAPNAYDENCPTRIVLDRIADKWTVLVLGLLSQNCRRFNQLRREIGGITQKMLSQTLKSLERDGLATRHVSPAAPISVEYAITPLGRTLADHVDRLRDWAQGHIVEVLESPKTI